jgi:hypothetical protein
MYIAEFISIVLIEKKGDIIGVQQQRQLLQLRRVIVMKKTSLWQIVTLLYSYCGALPICDLPHHFRSNM